MTTGPIPQPWSGLSAGRRPPHLPVPTTSGRSQTTVIIDDDPTGPQCVRDVPVVTSWTNDDLAWGLAQDSSCLFVLTNSRSLPPETADAVTRQVVHNALRVAGDQAASLRFLSRSDSTLRGHFPVETDAILAILQQETTSARGSVVVIAPAFPSAGRVTLDAVHWLVAGELATPVAMTDYAQDRSFHYSSSDLREWVAEKAGAATIVTHLDLDLVRSGTDGVVAALQNAPDTSVIVVDAIDEADLDVLAEAVAVVEASGRHVVLRGGPSLARAVARQPLPPPLTDDELSVLLPRRGGHGLVVVGSHVSLSTRQLALVDEVRRVEVDVDDLLAGEGSDARYVDLLVRSLTSSDTLLSTSRLLRHGVDEAESLSISARVAAGLVRITRGVLARSQPAWLMGKGGVTSSDLVSKSAAMRRAVVVGQLLPGLVPVWRSADSPSSSPCVVYPGNVGADDGLAVCVQRMRTAVAIRSAS